MARQEKLTHARWQGQARPRVKEAGYRGEYGGQLIASFETGGEEEIVKAWLAKKEQAARLLHGEMKGLGVGVAKDGKERLLALHRVRRR
jgi:uncharacterized protein YkwD